MSERTIPIHTSDRIKFKECRLAWHFSSVLRLARRPKVAATPLGFGTAIHAGLQAYKDPRSASFPQHVKESLALTHFLNAWKSMRVDAYGTPLPGYEDEYYDYKDLGVAMLTHYFLWNLRNTNKIVAVEVPFEVPILSSSLLPLTGPSGEPVAYRGKVDAIEEDDTGYWIVDYKTVGRWEDEDTVISFLQRDDQMLSYAWALQRAIGLKVNGVIYEQLYKGAPKEPERLKSARQGRGLSTNKQQDTSYELFLQAINKTGEHVEAYSDILTYLREGGKQYFRRIAIRRSQAELDYVGRMVYLEAKEMVDNEVAIYPSPSKFKCRYCDYKAPCEATFSGGDVHWILENNYIKTKEHYVDYGAES